MNPKLQTASMSFSIFHSLPPISKERVDGLKICMFMMGSSLVQQEGFVCYADQCSSLKMCAYMRAFACLCILNVSGLNSVRSRYTWYKLNEWMQVEILQIFGQSLETEPWYRFPYVQFMKVYFDVLFQESSIVQRKLGMKKAFGSMAFVTSLVPGIIMALFFAQIKLLARPLLSIPSSWGFGESYDEAQAVEQLVVLRPRDAPEAGLLVRNFI